MVAITLTAPVPVAGMAVTAVAAATIVKILAKVNCMFTSAKIDVQKQTRGVLGTIRLKPMVFIPLVTGVNSLGHTQNN